MPNFYVCKLGLKIPAILSSIFVFREKFGCYCKGLSTKIRIATFTGFFIITLVIIAKGYPLK